MAARRCRGALVGLAALVGGAALGACGDRPRPQTPPPPPGDGSDDGDDGDDTSDLTPDRPALPEVPEEERIAAIELAMNQLAPVAQQCWAAAAAADLRVHGDVRAEIQVGPAAGAGATVRIAADSTDDAVLTRCLSTVLAAYPWAPPLAGQVVELPFHFDAPRMQNVIDRRLVPHRRQAGVDVAVLLDQVNSDNPALSLLEVSAPAGTRLGPREVERTELWVARAPMKVTSAGGGEHALAAGDVMVAPAGARLELVGDGGALAAVIALVPGGREGTARAGALPGRTTTMAVRARPVQPTFVSAAAAKVHRRPGLDVTILVEKPAAGGAVALSMLAIAAGTKVPPHVHAGETEALYLLSGGGTMTVAGATLPVTETSVIQVPRGVEHAFEATAATLAIQLYTPAGPEQRFKKPPAPAR